MYCCKASHLLIDRPPPYASAFQGDNYSHRPTQSPPPPPPPPLARVRPTENFSDREGLSVAPYPRKAPSPFADNSRTPTRFNGRSPMAVGGSGASGAPSKPTLYDILSVPQNATLAEIKSAYRHLARRYHPDVCSSADREECTRTFVRLQEAYETLSDPVLRRNYDCRLGGKTGVGINGDWSAEWLAQLEEQKRRSAANRFFSSTWGRRMRSYRVHRARPRC